LHELLIPPEIEALGADDVLLIAPHAQLHRLPFHALCDDQQTLAAQVPTILVPSLSALEALLQRSRTRPGIERALAVGVADFDARARHLPDARAEIEMLQALFGQRVTVLWQAEATREAMLGMQRAGELAGYDVIHFATHARLDHAAPSQSSILLYDDDLAFADILTLGLHAKLVVLSSCEGALGESYAGDEIVGLAQGFFHAGAQAVVASLWPVEDAATRELMQRLYRRLAAGADVAHALRSAQREMAAAGYAPYHWAPFVVIGLP
jgi:CHAT domain-containing protein